MRMPSATPNPVAIGKTSRYWLRICAPPTAIESTRVKAAPSVALPTPDSLTPPTLLACSAAATSGVTM